jgi:inhibitor of cysteine peptidase
MNVRILAAVLLATAPLLGCAGKAEPPQSGPPTDAQTQTIAISYDELLNQKNISRDITLPVGGYLQVSLGSNASTGYQWAEQMRISDPKVLVQTGHEAIAARENRPGASGSQVWVLQATGLGTATVTTTYGRPWEGGEKDTWTFTANVTVQ